MYWAYDLIAQSEDGQIKIIMERKSEEEIKIVYDSPKYVQGEKPHRRYRSEVIKVFLSSWTFYKIASQRGVRHWIRGEQREATNIFKDCYLHIKYLLTNSLTALMWK